MKRCFQVGCVALLLSLVTAPRAPAAIGEKYQGAILQRDMENTVSGEVGSGHVHEVKVIFQGQTYAARVEKRRWSVDLPPQPLGGPHSLTFLEGKAGSNTVDDIYFGDVWLCIGQSNMVFPMTKMHSPETWEPAIDDNFPMVRFPGRKGWQKSTDIDAIKNFPGTPYYFGRELHKALGVPIGLIPGGAGGTTLWQWTPGELHQSPELEGLYEVMKSRNDLAHEMAMAGKRMARDFQYPPAEGFSSYRYPYFPISFGVDGTGLVDLENWVPRRAARGIIFWQGENDVGLSANYEPLFRGMLRRWRSNANRDWPFIFIQLPTYTDGPGAASNMDGIEGLRDAQRRVAASEANTQMMVSYDIYGRGIHPASKEAYGSRLAVTVLGMVYGKDVPWCSPEFEKAEPEGREMRLSFAHGGNGLKIRTGDGETLNGFTIAGPDGVFHPASAEIHGQDSVKVRSDQVADPVAVRYAWARSPVANLVGDGNLPVSPFRSDDWELYPLSGL